ncbi:MAG: hypothetical protein OXG66_10985 [Acidimicrobiaceae bacterium]|nr:hypothetical protein [Acidimicrobiaceae bacterium]
MPLLHQRWDAAVDLVDTIDTWAQYWNDNPSTIRLDPSPPTTSSSESNEDEPP